MSHPAPHAFEIEQLCYMFVCITHEHHPWVISGTTGIDWPLVLVCCPQENSLGQADHIQLEGG